jgi:hypothetical protein
LAENGLCGGMGSTYGQYMEICCIILQCDGGV